MIKIIDDKEYRVSYTVSILYNKYAFNDLDHACNFIRYCVLGCTDIKDLSDVTIRIQYEEVNDDRETD